MDRNRREQRGQNRTAPRPPPLPEVRDLHEIKYVIPHPLVGTVIGPYCHVCPYKTAIDMTVMIIRICTVINVLKSINLH